MPKPALPRAFVCLAVAVSVVAAAGCTKTATSSSASNPDASPAPAAAAGTVTGLRVSQPHPWSANPAAWKATVSWHPPAQGGIDHYEVARDGRTVNRSVDGTSFQDSDVEPSATYHYQVTAVTADGTASEPTSAVLKTGEPSLQDARLDGKYVTRFTPTSSTLGMNQTLPALVIFTATCKIGACDTVYRRSGLTGSGTLHQAGTSYTGSLSAPFAMLSCQHSRINESLTFAIHVTKGAVVKSRWAASAFEGTLTEVASSSGCVTATNHWTITGKTSQ